MLIIDRFENQWAVIEFNNILFNIPRSLLSADAKEGDVINIQVTVDSKATKQTKNTNNKLLDNLFEE